MQFPFKSGQFLGLLAFVSSSFFHLFVNSSLGIAEQTSPPDTDIPAVCNGHWQRSIDAIINHPKFARAQWGILVQPLDAERPLYALNERRYFLGASTVKLLTTAAALSKLGANYRIRTPFYASGSPPVLETLRVAGRGDPSVTTEEISAIAQQLYRQGVRQIDQLIADDRYFSQPHRPSTWEGGDLFFAYAPAINSLILNQNQFSLAFSPQQIGEPVKLSWQDEIAATQWQFNNSTLTSSGETSSRLEIKGILGQPALQIRGTLGVDTEPFSWELAVLDPGRYFLETLKTNLELAGIEVGQLHLATPPERFDSLAELTAIESPSLGRIIQEINQESNNLYAEALLRHLSAVSTGAARQRAANTGSLSLGLDVVQDTLTELGIDSNSYILADASGLSRHNLVSPEALVQTLVTMTTSPHFVTYRNSLGVAGISGTLENRFQKTPVRGNLRGKTGTMRNVSALSGYLEVGENRPWVFSIILNQTTEPTTEQRKAIDEIVLILSKVKSCHEIRF
ncbi:MAG: D-alanyl-D-alanine carboxypeptidase/D-alanyl-D-alanine-endopeptidase [Cyanobacteriota bacterium]|nr:D-alanyl-D-alanine carboxypeptidase/D-alanyl-D-alanine-endopeptidase [Cyanobacteriota bacterium]